MARDPRSELIQGVEAHRAGRPDEAAAAYRRVLAIEPANADALNLLGVLSVAAGRLAEGLAFHERAVKSNPHFADAHHNKGVALRALGRVDEALAAFARAVALNGSHADAYLNLGAAQASVGQAKPAIETLTAMTKAVPQDPRGFYNLGLVLMQAGKSAEAAKVLSAAERLQPNSPEIRIALADANAEHGNIDAAIAALEHLLADDPASVDVADRLPSLLLKANRAQEAVTAYEKAIAQARASGDAPRQAARHAGLAEAYRALGNWAEAITSYERSLIGTEPAAESVHNIAEIMAGREWMATASIAVDDAVRLKQDDRFIHNAALYDLKRGQLAAGWEKYEARHSANHTVAPHGQPRWTNEDLAGRRILVWPEQGVGDQILYAGVLPDLIARAGHVIVEVEPRLVATMARAFPQASVIAKGADIATVPGSIDFQIPMGSLPRSFRKTFAQFPKHSGYLKADPARVEALRRRYAALAGSRRIVGLSWRSRIDAYGPAKSAALLDLADILRTPNIMFVNLQYGDCADELAAAKRELGVEIQHDGDIDPLRDLEGFFAQVAAMDLVVTTSNTTVHAAGAMNVPTSLLLPKGVGSMWYWFMNRDDSPWYPSVRLFRQPEFHDGHPWAPAVAARVGAALQRWSDSSAAKSGVTDR